MVMIIMKLADIKLESSEAYLMKYREKYVIGFQNYANVL